MLQSNINYTSFNVVRVRHRPSVSKRAAQKFDMKRFNLKKLSDVGIEISTWLKSHTGL